MVNKLLYRVTRPRDAYAERGEEVYQFVVPESSRQLALNGCHANAGHYGRDRAVSLLTERFYWPGMVEQMMEQIRRCGRCIKYAARPEKEELYTLSATAPMELIHVDYTTIEIPENKRGGNAKANVLVVTDHFTRFAQAFITPDQTAATTAKVLWDRIFMVLGIPGRIYTDGGAAFVNKLMQQLCQLAGVQHLRTTAHNPAANGQVERMNATLIASIGKLEDKSTWISQLPTLVHCFNATRSSVTGYSPHFLMFGRRARIPVDYQFPDVIPEQSEQPTKRLRFVQEVARKMRAAYKAAEIREAKERKRYKRYYDRDSHAVNLLPDDLVLVKDLISRGASKIRDRWEADTYKVLERLDAQIPVYRVQNLTNQKIKILHRNKLLAMKLFDGNAETKQEQEETLQPTQTPAEVQVTSEAPEEKCRTAEDPAGDAEEVVVMQGRVVGLWEAVRHLFEFG